MGTGGITSETVQQTLKAIQRDGDRATSSLTVLAVVGKRLEDRRFPDDPVHRILALSDLLADIVTRRLAEARGIPVPRYRGPAATGGAAGGAAGEGAGKAEDEGVWIARDFQGEDAVRQAWSSLFYRFLARRPFRASELSRISGFSPRHLRRCFASGYALLSQALVEMETATLASAVTDRPSSPTPSPPLIRGNPPRRANSFVGRAEAVAALRERLRTAGILTLMGPGGVGKTRLAVEALRTVAAQYRDGAWFIALDALRDGTLVPGTVARTLEIEEQADRPMLDVLIEALAGRQLLLVLDNCEHVIEESAELADALLRRCPDLGILATSRKRLNIEGEEVMRVAALALPAAHRELPEDHRERSLAHHLMDYSAVRLFVERAAAVASGFRLDVGNAAAVVEICRQLDGIPLAIEIVAPHAHRLPVTAIAAQLHEVLPKASHRAQGTPERQRTVDAAIAWSHRLMTEAEKHCFARLAVFRGGWTFDAAKAVCGDDWINPVSVEAILFSLHDSSLIADDSRGDEPRGRYLETMREYAHAQLAASGELQALARRHAECFMRYAEQAEPELKGPDQAAWLNRLEIDHDNLRTAIGWALETGEIEIGLRLAGALWRFWYTHGYVREGSTYLDQLLAAETGAVPDFVRAKALHAAGTLAIYRGHHALARRTLESAINLGQRMGDRGGTARAMYNLATVAYESDDYPTARDLYEHCLALFESLGDRRSAAIVRTSLGSVEFAVGSYQQARSLFTQARVEAQQLGDPQLASAAMYWLGIIAHRQGRYDRATHWLQAGLAISIELGDSGSAAHAILELGSLAIDIGEFTAARQKIDDAMARFDELGDDDGIGEAHAQLGDWHLAQGLDSVAREEYLMSRECAVTVGNKLGVADAECGLGLICSRAGDDADACAHLLKSLDAYRSFGAIDRCAGLLEILASRLQAVEPDLAHCVAAAIDDWRQASHTVTPLRFKLIAGATDQRSTTADHADLYEMASIDAAGSSIREITDLAIGFLKSHRPSAD